MRRFGRLVGLVAAVALAAAACTGTGEPTVTGDAGPLQRGGTLRVAMLQDVPSGLDPQKEYYTASWELFRCCLLRTLVSYDADPGAKDGDDLRPDLAEALPRVSGDGLRWTFRLKEGVRYGPPFQDREVVAADVIRALERTADPEVGAGYAFYYSVIEGFDGFAEGRADDIAGLRAPDPRTLVVTLTEPTPDFGHRMALPATAPLPDGAADGHEDGYGRFLVATGPYMLEGSQELDFTLDPSEQAEASGYQPGRTITLVRNPAWDRGTDELRPAYVDRIEIAIGGSEEGNARRIDTAAIDLQLDGMAPAEQVQRYQKEPDLKRRLFVDRAGGVRYLSFNLAAPPFDDVHVRRAVNLAVDKDTLRRIRGGPLAGEIADHAFPASLLDDRLEGYEPYATEDHRGDLNAAKAEMAESAYDEDGDGVCDDPACLGILAVTDSSAPHVEQAELIARNLEPLGLRLEIEHHDRATMFERAADPERQTALALGLGWRRDYPDAASFGRALFGSDGIGPDGCCNHSLLGAGSKLLDTLGYEVTEVPSVDGRIEDCETEDRQDKRARCWAQLDRHLMEEVVPWVPYLMDNYVRTVSHRVVNYTFDGFAGLAALDHIAIRGGGEEPT